MEAHEISELVDKFVPDPEVFLLVDDDCRFLASLLQHDRLDIGLVNRLYEAVRAMPCMKSEAELWCLKRFESFKPFSSFFDSFALKSELDKKTWEWMLENGVGLSGLAHRAGPEELLLKMCEYREGPDYNTFAEARLTMAKYWLFDTRVSEERFREVFEPHREDVWLKDSVKIWTKGIVEKLRVLQ